MTTSKEKEILVGSKTQFAVRFEFQQDPDAGVGATAEESLSWGAFELWVAGKNLCQHRELLQSLPSVHWYLLPLLEWFTSNLDSLLREERLPVNASAVNAWRALKDTCHPPENLNEDESLEYEERWQDWRHRHSLASCREGGLVPGVVFRRHGDRIEISWGNDEIAGCPDHFRFDLVPGAVRLEPLQVAAVLYESLQRAAQHLHDQMPESPRLRRLLLDLVSRSPEFDSIMGEIQQERKGRQQ